MQRYVFSTYLIVVRTAVPDDDNLGSSVNSRWCPSQQQLAAAAPDDDGPDSFVEKLTADSTARALVIVFIR